MKRIYAIIALCAVIVITGGCRLSSNQTEETTVSVEELQEQIHTLQDKLDSYNKIYDDSLRESINKYCENYLSFDGNLDEKDVEKVKKYLTSDYYNEMINQPFNEGGKVDDDYIQSTAIDELYFENLADRLKHERIINDTTVTAICYQSVISDGKTKSYKVIYKFNLKHGDGKWLISAVEILS